MPGGYAVRAAGSDAPTLFTNFLIQITCSIFFEDCQQVWFGATLYVRGRLIPLLLADTELLQPKTILIRVRRAALQAGVNAEAPTVLDPGCKPPPN